MSPKGLRRYHIPRLASPQLSVLHLLGYPHGTKHTRQHEQFNLAKDKITCEYLTMFF